MNGNPKLPTDTADQHWNKIWNNLEKGSKWLMPEPDVERWAKGLKAGSAILDLGAGVGRHALALNSEGFDVAALDAAPGGLAEINRAGPEVETKLGRMDQLPFTDACFDHVLSWNVIYHGDETIVLNTISEVRRVLKPGGTFLLTMLSKRRLWLDRKNLNGPREISNNTWVFDENNSDKIHPHYYCNAIEMLCLFQGFEVLWIEDKEHETPGSWHWHLILERRA
jgi:tellurite methyltransferase